MTENSQKSYRIQLSVAIFKDKKLSYKNEMVVPTYYTRRSEARAHIKKEIRERLTHSSFFISPRVDYDLVRYTQEARCNTYLRYRIIEEKDLAIAESKQTKLLHTTESSKPLLADPATKAEFDEANSEA